MSSTKFLQRFEGKTQKIGKNGIRNALGDTNPGVVITTNSNITTNQKLKSANTTKTVKHSQRKIDEKKQTASKNARVILAKPPKPQNPFLVSNPFYLDEEEKLIKQKQKAQTNRKIESAKKAALFNQQLGTRTTSKNLSSDKRTGKQWSKLGGLGANIGGQDWLQRKNKLQRMQQFSGQVKSINHDKIKPFDPSRVKQQKKQLNSRQRMMQFARNVPKPTIRRHYESEEEQVPRSPQQEEHNQLSELEMYAEKHQKLRNMLKKEY